ncbi:MAG: tetratricopeptide repeat protein [Calditrichaeota bacterium]|nr:MAG: tetratricopeptide repeat protein [Calditrichota bacterium]
MKKSLLIFATLFLILSCGGSGKQENDLNKFTDADMMALADTYFEKGDYEKAITYYNKLLLEYPTSDLHIDAQLKIAEAHGRMDQFEEQMDVLLRLLRENIIPEQIPRIYIQIAKFYERAAQFNPGIVTSDSMDYAKALRYYKQAIKYEDSKDTYAKAEALYRQALVEAKIGAINKAIERYQQVPQKFPDTPFSVLAQLKLRDPSDVSELTVTDSALAVYRSELGLEAPEEPEATAPEEQAVPADAPEESNDNGSMDQTIDMIEQNSTRPDSTGSAPPDSL